jgi:DNA-binding GntR family transcriptional regulator
MGKEGTEAPMRADGYAGVLPELTIRPAVGQALAEAVYRELREAICDSRLEANVRLVQNALADQLGISRTPVRDALLRLAQEGLVQALPWRGGYAVSEFTAREVFDIYDVRMALEPVAAAHAAGHHTRAQLTALRELNERIAEEPESSVAEHYQLNQAFHAAIVEPCPNDILKRMLDQLWSMPSALRLYYRQVSGGPIAQTVDEHAQIIEALAGGAPETVDAAVRTHIEHARSATLANFDAAGH